MEESETLDFNAFYNLIINDKSKQIQEQAKI